MGISTVWVGVLVLHRNVKTSERFHGSSGLGQCSIQLVHHGLNSHVYVGNPCRNMQKRGTFLLAASSLEGVCVFNTDQFLVLRNLERMHFPLKIDQVVAHSPFQGCRQDGARFRWGSCEFQFTVAWNI